MTLFFPFVILCILQRTELQVIKNLYTDLYFIYKLKIMIHNTLQHYNALKKVLKTQEGDDIDSWTAYFLETFVVMYSKYQKRKFKVEFTLTA